jgi:ribosome-associated protein
LKSRELSVLIAELAAVKKAKNVAIMNLGKITDMTDYYVICTGDSDTHVKAIADAIDDGVKDHGVRVWRKEGYKNLQWVLLDFVDVVAHVFQPRVRAYYELERLWGDAETEWIDDDNPQRNTAGK